MLSLSKLTHGGIVAEGFDVLRFLRGDRADSTMNCRLRDAALGFLAPQNFDCKGFADSGRKLAPSEFAARLQAIREDYPDAAYYSLHPCCRQGLNSLYSLTRLNAGLKACTTPVVSAPVAGGRSAFARGSLRSRTTTRVR